MPELAKPGLGMQNSTFSSKSAGLPPRQIRNVLAFRRILLGRLAGDRAVFDAPELGIAVPAIQRLAIEDRAEALVVGGQGRRRPQPAGQQQQAHRRKGYESRETSHRQFLPSQKNQITASTPRT